jgi:hypothetical protein
MRINAKVHHHRLKGRRLSDLRFRVLGPDYRQSNPKGFRAFQFWLCRSWLQAMRLACAHNPEVEPHRFAGADNDGVGRVAATRIMASSHRGRTAIDHKNSSVGRHA